MPLTNYHKLLIVAAVAIFSTGVPYYINGLDQGMTELHAPKYWVLLFCAFSLPLLLSQGTAWKTLKLPVTIWCFGYAWVTIAWFVGSSQSEMQWQEVRWRFLAILEILTFLMIFREARATRLARQTLVAAVLFGVALNIYEVFVPLSFSYSIGRSAGLYGNPNTAGEALVLGMILSVTVLASRYRGPFILLTGIGVLSTFSRSAMLMWVIAVGGLIFMRGISLKELLPACFMGFVLAVVIVVPRWDDLLSTWERSGVFNVNVQERLTWLTDPLAVSDYSSWERKYVAKQAWDKIVESPLLGTGTGSTRGAYTEPHNQYLAFMQDHGVIGVMIVPLFVLALTWRARGETRPVAIVFACAIMLHSFFTHELFHTAYSCILLSLMAAMTAASTDREIKRTMTTEMKEEETVQVLVGA